MTHPLANFAMALFASLPTVVIAVIGVVLSRVKLSKSHAKAKRLATVGFSLMAIQTIFGASIPAYAAMWTAGTGDRLSMINVITISGFVSYLLLLASLVFLLRAVLADRKSSDSSRGAV